jgi:F-type H+-transporting ATPase subunit a
MGEHSTWFHVIANAISDNAFENFEHWAQHYLGRTWQLPVGLTDTYFSMTHVVTSAFIAVLIVIGAIGYSGRISKQNKDRLIPEDKMGKRNFFELITDATLGLAEGVMGRKKAERFLPIIGTFVFFIFFNNIIGLIPGFVPATDTLKTNVALSLTVFVLTHFYGIKEHGFSYLKHFFGPVWYLAWLMFPIEVISHLARPLSLSLRLLGNIYADHKVLSLFFVMVPILVPLPFLMLGIMVCTVQTLVFSLLTMVYIEMATAHEEH